MTETKWQRFLKWFSKQPSPEKRIRKLRQVAILYAALGVLYVALAMFFLYNITVSYNYSQPVMPDLKWYNAISFLLLLVFSTGGFLGVAGFCFLEALWVYTQSLELRIKELEKKTEQKAST